ncbi:MAG: type III secretion system inner rod subunit SctI [Kiritimatiellae bacterium]|nr:type III secretion system inner rod subunit SctI [Kiritimatiellia bacterium]
METLAVEAIRASQSSATAQAATQTAGPSAPPSASAVSRFEAAMAADAPQGVSEIPFASQLSAVWRSAQANNQGMLHRIRALSELQGRHSLSAAEMVELQYEVMNLSFQQEVVTKVADKSSSAVQTLIKNQ